MAESGLEFRYSQAEMSLDFQVFVDLPAEEFSRMWEAADSPEIQLLKTECFFGASAIEPIEAGSYYEELCREFSIEAQSWLYVSHNKTEVFTVNQMLHLIFQVVQPYEAKALFQGESLTNVRPDEILVIPNDQVSSILAGQACKKIYEYGRYFIYESERLYRARGIVIELQDGRVVVCQNANLVGLVFTIPSPENMSNYEDENYFQGKTILLESRMDKADTISAIEQSKGLQGYNKVEIIIGDLSINLEVSGYELRIRHTLLD